MGGRDERERYQYSYQTVLRYLVIKCQDKTPADFFEKNNMRKIAVYGVGELGKCLIRDLVDSNIQIAYIVDQAFTSYPKGYLGIPVISVDDIQKQQDVDVMVVTVLYELNTIVDLLLQRNIDLGRIINISDIVYSI